MRAFLSLVVVLSIGALHSAAAQDSASRQGVGAPARTKAGAAESKPATKPALAEVKPALSQTEKEAAAARTRNEAQARDWDDKMKRTMRSICSGANGC